MRDEMDARIWAELGHRYAEDMGRLFASLKYGFVRLTEIQFRAPWRKAGTGRT